MELIQTIADNIVRLLEENNQTQAELSAYLDISRQTLSNYLKGNSTIDSVRLVKIANFFNVPITSLLEASAQPKPPMLLRAAAQDLNAIESVEATVLKYLNHYIQLCSKAGGSSRFMPEQHDLLIEHAGQRLSVNYELRRYPPAKFKIDEQLSAELYNIADSQRKILGLNESGAIELIRALTLRGISVIFLDLGPSNIFGLSICDSIYGCCIFVNSNASITIERQLFTVAHEYAHLILHRPLFSREASSPMSSQYVDLLDKMADTFAGRLLCPPDIIFPYAKYYSTTDSTLKSIVPVTVYLKQKLHVSFQSMLMALSNYGLLSKSVVSEYYRWARNNNSIKQEPWPLKDDQNLYGLFMKVKEEHIVEIFHKLFFKEPASVSEIMYFLGCDSERATTIYKRFQSELDNFEELF